MARGPFNPKDEIQTEVIIDAVAIAVGSGLFAFIDHDDLERVNRYNWKARMTGLPQTYYVYGNPNKKWRCKTQLPRRRPLHRFIMKARKGRQVYAINGNNLDCRKANLTFKQSDCIYSKKYTG